MEQKFEKQLPLYKELDSKRTKGIVRTLGTNGGLEIQYTGDNPNAIYPCPMFGFVNSISLSKEETSANVQYTALSINNLSNIADKLDAVIKQNERILALYNGLYNRTQGGWADAEVADFKEMVQLNKEAKEALKAIS